MSDQAAQLSAMLASGINRRTFLAAGTGVAGSLLIPRSVLADPAHVAANPTPLSAPRDGARDISQEFAAFAAGMRYEDLPADAVEAAKKSLLDTLGVMLAASGVESATSPLIELLKETGGKEEATVFGENFRLPASAAAFVNGALAHSLDFDPQTPWGAHCDSSIVPTVLALAELRGGCSGADLITAIAVGQEVFIRLRLNVGWHMDWNLSTVVGCFSATCAGACLMNLNETQTANAMGIVSMQSSGTMELVFGVGSDLRGMYAGFCSQACVTAVRLAQRGMTGISNLFEGEAGHFSVYFRGEYDRAKMLHELGTKFSSGGMLYKYWPAVGNAHTYIHASLMLSCENNIDTKNIKEIVVYVGDFQQRMCTPLEVRCAPTTAIDAKFSLPFLVALALARRQVKVSDFSPESLSSPDVLALAKKVVPVVSADYNWKSKLPDGRVEIRMVDGKVYSQVGSNVPGSPEAPLTWDQLTHKFYECGLVAKNPVSMDKSFQAAFIVKDLQRAEGVTDLLRLIQAA